MTTALLVVDVQESFRQRESWTAVSNPAIVDRVSDLVAWSRAEGNPVYWVLHSEPGTGGVFDPVGGHVRLIDGLVPDEAEPVLIKTAHNAFTTTNLQRLLTERGVGNLVVAGIRTEQCCETTARIGSDLGYGVTFVTDATATMPLPHWDLPATASLSEVLADPRTLSVQDVVARTEYVLAGRFAQIASTAELTGVANALV
ncbi:MAG TPA: isochorismatase family protein [Pseudonocardia sp.]|nr:isochorismatase family protein [Pseudonocardia sp.]